MSTASRALPGCDARALRARTQVASDRAVALVYSSAFELPSVEVRLGYSQLGAYREA